MKKLEPKDFSTIIKMRGLGFSQKEIADNVNVSPATISYQLLRIKKFALKEGLDVVFKYYINWPENI